MSDIGTDPTTLDAMTSSPAGQMAPGSQPAPSNNAPPQVDEARKAHVKEWVDKILAAKAHHKKAFERMRECQEIANKGHDGKWPEDNYTVPVLLRHINVAVAALYARNPTATAKRKKKVQFKLWDGTIEAVQQAMAAMSPPADPVTGAPMPGAFAPDPNAAALLQELQEVHLQNVQMDRMGKTLEILFDHYHSEQDAGYKQQLKACVRRTKVCSVAWSELGYQRILEPDPDITARIADATSQMETLKLLIEQNAEGDIQTNSAKFDELRLLVEDLRQRPELIVMEGPTWAFPKADHVIIDPDCVHLKTLAGAKWLAKEFPPLTPDYIKKTTGVDVSGNFTACTADGKPGDSKDQQFARMFAVQNKETQQTFMVCEGYPDFIKEPAEPDVKVSRFWTLFPLVFNEVEDDKEIYPPSDVWVARHMQREYNTVRQSLREHRIQNRPKYAAQKGKLENKDLTNLSSCQSGDIIELNALTTGEKIEDILQQIKTVPIDPNLYEVSSVQTDIERTIGSSSADLGAASDVTATQSSIIEQGRSTTNSDNVDDLDDWLSEMARAESELMLLELAPETVTEIAGPGAVWPTMKPTRQQIAKDLWLEVKAGSSGRPNRAAELANMERGLPFLLQIPGVNPAPLGKRYADLLDMPVDDFILEGIPSIQALNAIAGKGAAAAAPEAAAGQAEGPKGANNAPSTQTNEPGPQPAYPAPMAGA